MGLARTSWCRRLISQLEATFCSGLLTDPITALQLALPKFSGVLGLRWALVAFAAWLFSPFLDKAHPPVFGEFPLRLVCRLGGLAEQGSLPSRSKDAVPI